MEVVVDIIECLTYALAIMPYGAVGASAAKSLITFK